MKASKRMLYVLGAFIVLGLVACSSPSSVDTSATVSAAVQATQSAQANVDATVQAVVKATMAAQSSPTAASQATATRASTTSASPAATSAATAKPPTLTPTPSVNYVTMTEEELAALIDQAVQEAVAATTTASTTTTTYTADGTLTTQEVLALQTAVNLAIAEISQAEALAQAYYDMYSQVATETLAALQAVEADLDSMATSMSAMATSLEQINQTLAQGLTLATNTITQLQATAAKASTTAQSAATKAKSWSTAEKADIQKRANAALATKPTNIPTDLRGTSQSVTTYIDTVRTALGDNKVSKTELSAISVAGANAVSGLNKFGGTQFQGLSTTINNTTKQLALGETQKAKTSLAGLDQSARSLTAAVNVPSGPSGPGASGGPQPPRK